MYMLLGYFNCSKNDNSTLIKSSQVLYEKHKFALKFPMNFKIAELLFEMSKIFQGKHLLVITIQYFHLKILFQ